MSIRDSIQSWLGITDSFGYIKKLNSDFDEFYRDQRDIKADIVKMKSELVIHNQALARIIAKLDPIYPQSEISPERRAASYEIALRVMNKLYSETTISRQYDGPKS